MTDEEITAKGFTPWHGGDMPCDPGTVVEAMFAADPLYGTDTPIVGTKIRQAVEFRWSWIADGTGGDINGYRLLTVNGRDSS